MRAWPSCFKRTRFSESEGQSPSAYGKKIFLSFFLSVFFFFLFFSFFFFLLFYLSVFFFLSLFLSYSIFLLPFFLISVDSPSKCRINSGLAFMHSEAVPSFGFGRCNLTDNFFFPLLLRVKWHAGSSHLLTPKHCFFFEEISEF